MTSDSSEFPIERGLSPFVFLGLIAAINLATPLFPVPTFAAAILSGLVLTPIYVAAVVAFGLSLAKQQLPWKKVLFFLALAALVWLGVQFVLLPLLREMGMQLRQSGQRPSGFQRLLFTTSLPLQDLAMIAGACLCGTLLARMIRHPNMLGPIGAAIALIDIWGVLFSGPVSQLLANKATQPLAQKALAAGPKLQHPVGMPHGFDIDIPSVGVGDFLFIALLLSVVVNLGMNWRTSAQLMWGLVSMALLSITFLPLFFYLPNFALPGLVFIGAAVVLPNWKYFRFTREEQFALLYAGILVLILTIGIYFGLKAALPPETVTPTALKQH